MLDPKCIYRKSMYPTCVSSKLCEFIFENNSQKGCADLSLLYRSLFHRSWNPVQELSAKVICLTNLFFCAVLTDMCAGFQLSRGYFSFLKAIPLPSPEKVKKCEVGFRVILTPAHNWEADLSLVDNQTHLLVFVEHFRGICPLHWVLGIV